MSSPVEDAKHFSNLTPRRLCSRGRVPVDKRFKLAFRQRTVTTSLSLSSICPFTRSHHPLCAFVPRCNTKDTSGSDLVCHVHALADASNVGESLRLEHPLGHADEIRAVRQTLPIRDPHLLENVDQSNGASFTAENRVSKRLTAQTKF